MVSGNSDLTPITVHRLEPSPQEVTGSRISGTVWNPLVDSAGSPVDMDWHRSDKTSRIREVPAMPRYRCFCLTDDERIITGAFIEAENVAAAVEVARQQWREAVGFDHLEIWLGRERLVPPEQG